MDKQILPYSDIRIGMKCYDCNIGDYRGTIEFIGTLEDMVEMGYEGMVNDIHDDIDEEDFEDIKDYQWVMVDPNDIFGPYLSNYNCDPSGVVCYKEEKLYTREEVIKLFDKLYRTDAIDSHVKKAAYDKWVEEILPIE